jgi:hypothetical protein
MELSDCFHGLGTLSRGKRTHYPIDRRLCGSQSRCEYGGKERNPFPWWELNLECPACKAVTLLAELFQFMMEGREYTNNWKKNV